MLSPADSLDVIRSFEVLSDDERSSQRLEIQNGQLVLGQKSFFEKGVFGFFFGRIYKCLTKERTSLEAIVNFIDSRKEELFTTGNQVFAERAPILADKISRKAQRDGAASRIATLWNRLGTFRPPIHPANPPVPPINLANLLAPPAPLGQLAQASSQAFQNRFRIQVDEALVGENKVRENGQEQTIRALNRQLYTDYSSSVMRSLLEEMHPDCGLVPGALKMVTRYGTPENLQRVQREVDQFIEVDARFREAVQAEKERRLSQHPLITGSEGNNLEERRRYLYDAMDTVGLTLSANLKEQLKGLNREQVLDPQTFLTIAEAQEGAQQADMLRALRENAQNSIANYARAVALNNDEDQIEINVKETVYPLILQEYQAQQLEANVLTQLQRFQTHKDFSDYVLNRIREFRPFAQNEETLEQSPELWQGKDKIAFMVQIGVAGGHYFSAVIDRVAKRIDILNSIRRPDEQTFAQDKAHIEEQVRVDILPHFFANQAEIDQYVANYDIGYRQYLDQGCGEACIYNCLAVLGNDRGYLPEDAGEDNNQMPAHISLAIRHATNRQGESVLGDFYYQLP